MGGIVVARYGANAYQVIHDAKEKLAELEGGLPPGVTIRTAYDRSDLIERAIHTLRHTLIEEMIVVALVCILFLLHARSALVAIFVIPSSMLVEPADHVPAGDQRQHHEPGWNRNRDRRGDRQRDHHD